MCFVCLDPQCFIQLKRPSDGVTSEALPFEYYPLDSGRRSIWINGDGITQTGTGSEFLEYVVSQQQQQTEETKSVLVESTIVEQPSVSPVPEAPITLIDHQEIADPDQSVNVVETAAADKTSEWVRTTEFEATPEPEPIVTEADRTLNELLDHVAELDEIYEDHQLRRDSDHVEQELRHLDRAMPKADQPDENFDELFDDAATYTSLQIAFKNPVSILKPYPAPLVAPPPTAHSHTPENLHYDLVEPLTLINPPAPLINVKQSSPKKDEPLLPPLPPKRAKKQMPLPTTTTNNDENQSPNVDENRDKTQVVSSISRRSSSKSLQPRPQSQIIIMRSPSESPLNKKLPPAPPLSNGGSCATLPRPKKSGFFSKLFSRRKSKSDLATASAVNLNAKSSTDLSRQPSIHSLGLPLTTDGSSASKSRSKKSNPGVRRAAGQHKPCGRSVSSVSGKRPHLTADIVHIPLKGDSTDSLPMRGGGSLGHGLTGNDAYERSSTATLSNNLDRKTVSALQLADLPFQDGNMELIAIADRQSLKNLCESEFGVVLDPSVDLTEAEHYALYTAVAPHATQSEFDEASAYYAPVEAGEILTQDEVARRLTGNFS